MPNRNDHGGHDDRNNRQSRDFSGRTGDGERRDRQNRGTSSSAGYGDRSQSITQNERMTRPGSKSSQQPRGRAFDRPATQQRSENGYGRPNARPSATQARPSATQARPSATQARPSATQARPSATQARPSATQARPSATQARPSATQRSERSVRAPKQEISRAPEQEATTRFEIDEPLPRENLLSGRNPIREAIKSGRDMERLLVVRGDLSGSAREIISMARERHIVVQVVDRARLDEITPNHQGMIAFASAFRYSTVDDIFALAMSRGEAPLLIILDGVTDPHNLGAIIRSAECAGAHGVIVPERRAVGLTPAAVKASAGAVEYLPVARVGNLPRLIKSLKEQGVWITAADMSGESYTGVDLTGPMALVIGAEGEGVSRLVLESCDRRVALPIRGKIASLNASVAAGVLLYEICRQRG